jgi:hypothetical protein
MSMDWEKVIASLRNQAKDYLAAAKNPNASVAQCYMMSGLTVALANALQKGLSSES